MKLSEISSQLWTETSADARARSDHRQTCQFWRAFFYRLSLQNVLCLHTMAKTHTSYSYSDQLYRMAHLQHTSDRYPALNVHLWEITWHSERTVKATRESLLPSFFYSLYYWKHFLLIFLRFEIIIGNIGILSRMNECLNIVTLKKNNFIVEWKCN